MWVHRFCRHVYLQVVSQAKGTVLKHVLCTVILSSLGVVCGPLSFQWCLVFPFLLISYNVSSQILQTSVSASSSTCQGHCLKACSLDVGLWLWDVPSSLSSCSMALSMALFVMCVCCDCSSYCLVICHPLCLPAAWLSPWHCLACVYVVCVGLPPPLPLTLDHRLMAVPLRLSWSHVSTL